MKKTKSWSDFYNKGVGLRQHLGSLYTHSLLFEEICKENPRRILEVGTGSGMMSIFLSLMGYEVTAVDNNLSVLDAARSLNSRFSGQVEYIAADAFELKQALKDRRFDLVFSQGFFEHFDNEIIKRLLTQQLALSDKAFISVPSIYYPVRDFGNERLLAKGRWRNILSAFNIEELRYYGFFFPSSKMLLFSLLNPAFHYRVAFSFLSGGSSHILIKVKVNPDLGGKFPAFNDKGIA